MSHASTRRGRTAASLVVLGLLAAGCGEDEANEASTSEETTGTEGTTDADEVSDDGATDATAVDSDASATEAAASVAGRADEAGAPSEDGAFPVTIEHQFGETTVESEPQRIVSIGFNDHDFIYAVGEVPLGVRYWYGDDTDATQVWLDDVVEEEPVVLNLPELNVEAIAAADPDIVIAVNAGIDEGDYEQLSRIAPVITQSGEFIDYGQPWQETTTMIGAALGHPARAEELVDEVEGLFADAAAAHPEWAGRTVAVATYSADGVGAFASADSRARFFASLGFETPAAIDGIAGEEFYATLSFEQAAELDQDLLVWDQLSFTDGGRATVEGNSIVAQLAAMQEGRAIYLEDELEVAFGWSSVLSLPFALESVVPLVEEATAAG